MKSIIVLNSGERIAVADEYRNVVACLATSATKFVVFTMVDHEGAKFVVFTMVDHEGAKIAVRVDAVEAVIEG